jgi:hypothetical protein
VGRGPSYEYDVEQGEKRGTIPAQPAPRQSAATSPAAPAHKALSPAGRILVIAGTLLVATAVAAAWIVWRPVRRRK